MAEKPKKSKDKRSRRRRARRTEVETSSSDSDSDSNVSTKIEQTKAGAEESDVEMQDEASEATSEPAKTIQQKQVSDADFESWYLQQVTKELSDDLDKIRSASDFKDASLPVLITALKQGTALFSQDEKQRILGGAS